jgi:hypothetical protein
MIDSLKEEIKYTIKINNEYIDSFLLKNKKPFIRIGDSQGARTAIKWKCSFCSYEWFASPDSILNKGAGCHLCHRRAIITNERIDAFIKDKNFIRLENVHGARVPIKFKCLIDGYEWKTTPSTILNKNTGCFKCLYKRHNMVRNLLFSYYDKNLITEEFKIKCDGCKYYYRIDFFLNFKTPVFVEYNGKQHYEPCTFGRTTVEKATKKFNDQKKRDLNVELYCKKNNIHLLILPYTFSDNLIEQKIQELKLYAQ